MRNKVITAITTICMIVGLFIPMITSNETEVHAQTTPTTKSIMFGLKGLQGGQVSNVYMGKYPQSKTTNPSELSKLTEHVDYEKLKYTLNGMEADHYFAIEPIKWRVLSADGLLLSDTAIDGRQFYKNASSDFNKWDKSELKAWLNNNIDIRHDNTGATGFKGYAFSAEEQATLKKQETLNLGDIFLLSKEEAGESNYFANAAARIATNSEYASGRGAFRYWWLRSPGDYNDDFAAFVSDYGNVSTNGNHVYNNLGVRPALNLNPNSVLFTSATEGGKSTITGGDGEMSPILEYTGPDWKVTVKDTARDTFTASTKSDTTSLPAGGKIKVDWNNANTGSDEYISYMITDSGNKEALYYGSIPSNSANGSQKIKIPENLPVGDYNLRVFNEQKNGDKYTDYASDFKDIEFTVSNATLTKPAVSSISTDHTPASLDGTIKMTFSEEMDTTEGSVKLDTKTLNAGTWSNGDKTYTVPYTGLLNSKEYTVDVSGFESKLGGVMDDSTHTFTTVAANTPSSPKTGDSSNTTLYFGLLVISGIFVVGMKRRKELDRKEMSE